MIVHVFVRVCSPNTGVWESLSVEQQDSLWRTLPDIVERGGLIDHLDWPKSGRHLDCAQCSLRPVLRLGAASVIKSVAWCALRQICAPCVSRKQINANVFSIKILQAKLISVRNKLKSVITLIIRIRIRYRILINRINIISHQSCRIRSITSRIE